MTELGPVLRRESARGIRSGDHVRLHFSATKARRWLPSAVPVFPGRTLLMNGTQLVGNQVRGARQTNAAARTATPIHVPTAVGSAGEGGR